MDPQNQGTRSENPAGPGYPPPAPSQQFAIGNRPGQPDLVKRFVAYFIDGVILGVIAYLPGIIGIVGAAAAIAGWLMRDTLIEGRSPGKKIMGLQAVNAAGRPVSINESAIRNLPFVLGAVAALIAKFTIVGALLSLPILMAAGVIALVEGVMVLTGNVRFGDRFASTHVIDTQVQTAVQS
ncbi:MAG TPA: RDD family protein [Longimicrobium sp.]|nr:RDD family protein [Longimicrobium sp.]